MNSVTSASCASSKNVATPIMSSTSGIRSSFVTPVSCIVGVQAWNLTPKSFAVLIISSRDGMLVFFILLLIILVAMAVIPGSIPIMLGIGNEGFPTGDNFRLVDFFLVMMSIPQNVKYRWVSQFMEAAVVAKKKGGKALSIVPLEQTTRSFFFFSDNFLTSSVCTSENIRNSL